VDCRAERKEPSISGVPAARVTFPISDRRAGIGAPMHPSRRDRGTHRCIDCCPLWPTGIRKRPPRCAGLSAAAPVAAGSNGSDKDGSGTAPTPCPLAAGQGAEAGQACEVRGTQVGGPPPTLVGRQQPVGVNRPLEARQEGGPRRCGQHPRVVPRVEQVGTDPAAQGQIGWVTSPFARLRHCQCPRPVRCGRARRGARSRATHPASDVCRLARGRIRWAGIPTEEHRC